VRVTGELIPRNGVLAPTPQELRQRVHKLRRTGDMLEVETVTGGASSPRWPLRLSPERYLTIHPEGQHAALARSLVPLTPTTPAENDLEVGLTNG